MSDTYDFPTMPVPSTSKSPPHKSFSPSAATPKAIPMPVPELPSSPSSSSQSSSDHPHRTKGKSKPNGGKLQIPSNVKDLAKLLQYEERETKELHRMLFALTEQLSFERGRANDAEGRVKEVMGSLKSVNEARLAAVRDAAMANEQLKMYKTQLEAAQKEIFRAQELLDSIDERRYQAEKESAKARAAVRKMNEEILVWNAREEGRRAGIMEGLKKGKNIGYREGRGRRDTYLTQSSDTTEDDAQQFDTVPGDVESYVQAPRRAFAPASATPATPASRMQSPTPPQAATPVPLTASPPQASPPPAAAPVVPSEPVLSPAPTIIHNIAPSPVVHPAATVPPDNWIPSVGPDSIIRIPPPHEFNTTPIPSPAVSASRPVESTPPPVIVPPPRSQTSTSSHSQRNLDPIATNVQPRYMMQPRYSPESSSTTLSQFDIVTEANLLQARRSPLSDIAEVLSVQSPHPTMGGGGDRESLMPSISVSPRPRSPQGSTASRRSSRRDLNKLARRGSVSSSHTVPDITIQAPSRPTSDHLQSAGSPSPTKSPRVYRSMANLLSPEDARRPLPPPQPTPILEPPQAQAQSPLAPIDIPLGNLPPGFVPSHIQPDHHGHAKPEGGHEHGHEPHQYQQSPAPQHYQPQHHHHQQQQQQQQPSYSRPMNFWPTPESPRSHAVIPDTRALLSSDGEADTSTDTVSSDNTFTTPPNRNIKLASSIGMNSFAVPGSQTPAQTYTPAPSHGHSKGMSYASARSAKDYPLPESTIGVGTQRTARDYPLPESTIGVGTQRTARDYPLPESTIGGATPRTAFSTNGGPPGGYYSSTPYANGHGGDPADVALPESTLGGATPRSVGGWSSFTGGGKSKKSRKGSVVG